MKNNCSSDGSMQKKFIILNKIEIFNAIERPLNIFCLAVSFANILFILYITQFEVRRGKKNMSDFCATLMHTHIIQTFSLSLFSGRSTSI